VSASTRTRSPVVGNDAGQVRGGRYVVPGQPADGRALLMAPIEVSVNHSRPVAAVLAAARTPIRYGELRAKLTAQFASVGADQVDALLGGLIEQNLLITGLWAPMTELDALGHVCAELDAAGARDIPEIADAVLQLYAIRDELAAQDPAAPWSERIPLVERMRVLSDIAPVPLLVDTAVDCDLQIPEQVAQEAAEAVSVLYRLTPYPFGYPQWRDYHRQFRARYGPGAVVPAADLVADSGLGLPAGYLGHRPGDDGRAALFRAAAAPQRERRPPSPAPAEGDSARRAPAAGRRRDPARRSRGHRRRPSLPPRAVVDRPTRRAPRSART
jgi:hypothetical protein